MSLGKGFGVIALLAATALVNIHAASATTFTYASTSVTNGEVVNIQTPNAVTGLAGQIVVNGSGANAGQTLYAWCLDIFDDLIQTASSFNVGTLTAGHSPGGSNPVLSASQLAAIGSLILYGNANIGNAHVSAATQLAIWQVEYGNTFTFTGVGGATLALENTLLSGVAPGGNLLVYNGPLNLLTGPHNQDLAYLPGTGNDPLTSTPLPAAWLMFISGLVGLRWFRGRNGSAAAA